MPTAYLFPGQGSQKPGMGQDLVERSAIARARFEEADRILGFPLSQTMFSGTEDDLKRTAVTQPAIFLHSVALAEDLDAVANDAFAMAGHSLGEFSALVAAGALAFEDGLKLVYERAQAMQAACDAQPSAMAAIVGLEDTQVEAICAAIEDDVVVAANYNAPGQVVVSGSTEAVERAMEAAKAEGAKLAKALPVNGAFHSPLMEPARQRLAQALAQVVINPPRVPVYQNVTAQAETDPEVIRRNLQQQLTGPVRWTQTIQRMVLDGATAFVELGPGNVLQGLVKRIAKGTPNSGREA